MTIRHDRSLHQSQSDRLARWGADACVDIHCHCLPSMDDGPASLEQALELCRSLVEDGITDVIATPHQLGRYDLVNNAQAVQSNLDALAAQLKALDIPLCVHPGGEVRIDERIPMLLHSGQLVSLGSSGRYLLLELPHDTYIEPQRLIASLARRGMTVIIAHPERHSHLQNHPDAVLPWIESGASLQVTAGSLFGEFGVRAERAAWTMLELGRVDLIASDAHDAIRRPPGMSRAMEVITARLGRSVAARVCIENPQLVLAGQPMAAHSITYGPGAIK